VACVSATSRNLNVHYRIHKSLSLIPNSWRDSIFLRFISMLSSHLRICLASYACTACSLAIQIKARKGGPMGLWGVEDPTLSRQSAHRWRWGCRPHAPVALYTHEDSWYSFLLGPEWTPGPQWGWKDYVNWKKYRGLFGNQTQDLTTCGIVPPRHTPMTTIWILAAFSKSEDPQFETQGSCCNWLQAKIFWGR
jgi:hypothetical protein